MAGKIKFNWFTNAALQAKMLPTNVYISYNQFYFLRLPVFIYWNCLY